MLSCLRPRVSFALLTLLLAVSLKPAKPDTVYTYTGQPFTIATAPYTTKEFVTAVMTTQTPLPPNLTLGSMIFTNSLSLSDGVQTIVINPSLVERPCDTYSTLEASV
jgi:hypothetical protein